MDGNKYLASVLCAGLTVVLMTTSVGIASLVIWDENQNDTCAVRTDLVEFSYFTWLFWTGLVILIVNAIFLPAFIIYTCALARGKTLVAAFMFALLRSVSILTTLFDIAWFVVGAILYFKEIHTECPTGGALHKFGLALFILQCIGVGCSVLKSRSLSDSNVVEMV
jgi:hypothetical protein